MLKKTTRPHHGYLMSMNFNFLKQLKTTIPNEFETRHITQWTDLMSHVRIEFEQLTMLSKDTMKDIIALTFNMLMLLGTKLSVQEENLLTKALRTYVKDYRNALKDYQFSRVPTTLHGLLQFYHSYMNQVASTAPELIRELCTSMQETLKINKNDDLVVKTLCLRVAGLAANIELTMVSLTVAKQDAGRAQKRFQKFRTSMRRDGDVAARGPVDSRRREPNRPRDRARPGHRARSPSAEEDYDEPDSLLNYNIPESSGAARGRPGHHRLADTERSRTRQKSTERALDADNEVYAYETDTVQARRRHISRTHRRGLAVSEKLDKLLSRVLPFEGKLEPVLFTKWSTKTGEVDNGVEIMLIIYICSMFLTREGSVKTGKLVLDEIIASSLKKQNWSSTSCGLGMKEQSVWLRAIASLLRCSRLSSGEVDACLTRSTVYQVLTLEAERPASFDISMSQDMVDCELHTKLLEFTNPAKNKTRREMARNKESALGDSTDLLNDSSDNDGDGAYAVEHANAPPITKQLLGQIERKHIFYLFGSKINDPFTRTKTSGELQDLMEKAEALYEDLVLEGKYAQESPKKRLNLTVQVCLMFAYVICQTNQRNLLKSATIFSIDVLRWYVLSKERRNQIDLTMLAELYRDEMLQIKRRNSVEAMAKRCFTMYKDNQELRNNESLMVLQIIVLQAISFAVFGKAFACQLQTVDEDYMEKQEYV